LFSEGFEIKDGAFNKVFQVVSLNYAQAEWEFGITEPITIEFWVVANHIAYIEALPIHPTEVHVKEDEDGRTY
jgi:hypothetical protein